MGQGAAMWVKDLEDGCFNVRVKPEQTQWLAFTFAGVLSFANGISIWFINRFFDFYNVHVVCCHIRFTKRNLMWHDMPTSQFSGETLQMVERGQTDTHFSLCNKITFDEYLKIMSSLSVCDVNKKTNTVKTISGKTKHLTTWINMYNLHTPHCKRRKSQNVNFSF